MSSNLRSPCHCRLCQPAGEPDPRGVALQDHVQRHGWQVAGVIEEDDVPGWAYTVGLWHSYRSPEIAVLGLPTRTCMSIANLLAAKVRDGAELATGRRMDDVLKGHAVELREVRGEWLPVLFGQAVAFYRTPPLPMLQVCWPDPNEHFVWDAEASDSLHSLHPQLWLPPADHPAGPWATLAKEI
ncbi:DUF4262 domain-containing protein [Micromonosporaceae bacterium DT194]|uniref:DUF4262 domain-containing protein n=1 Tax=Melissospora conviva TaxID=3388432 RepID=UPI003C254D62